MGIEKVIKHTAKVGDSLKNFENSDRPIILIIDKKEYLFDYLMFNDDARILGRDPNNDGFPISYSLKLKNYRIKSLNLEPAEELCDFSAGQNIRLNEAGIIYKGQNARLKLIEKLHQEGKPIAV